MFSLFSKNRLSALLTLVSLSAMDASLAAWECCDSVSYECCAAPVECNNNRFYIGGFGGGIYSNSSKVTQMGTAFFTEAQGGPLAVLAQGHTRRNSAGFGGVQVGYEWARPVGCSCATIGAAGELEAFFFSHNKRGHLMNPTERLDEHDFFDSFKTEMSLCLVNAVFSYNSPSLSGFAPYVGGGIGAAHICLKNAKSIQVDPPEVGVNHFNSKRNDSSWAFAAQVKAGLRYKLSESFHIFGEYRYVYVDVSNYILGSTVYPGHAVTSPWNLKVNNIQYNAFAFGIQFDL